MKIYNHIQMNTTKDKANLKAWMRNMSPERSYGEIPTLQMLHVGKNMAVRCCHTAAKCPDMDIMLKPQLKL